jgi:MFS family permease
MFALLRNRDFGLLWLAGLISTAGGFALIVALPLHIYRLTDSTLATAGTFAASFLPGVLFGSVAGVFVDRWDRRRVMIAADVARALLLLTILIAPDRLELLYAVAALQGVFGLFFSPAENALLPLLVGEEQLIAANALNALNNNLGMLIGPALGSMVYAGPGITGAALVDSATFALSALLISRITPRARGEPETTGGEIAVGTAWSRMVRDWRAGLGIVRQSRPLMIIFTTCALSGIAEGVFLTLGLSPLVLDVLEGTPAQVGWLGTAQAVGGLIAGLIIARIGHRLSQRWLFGGGSVVLGLTDTAAFNARLLVGPGTPAVAVAMGCMTASGFPVVAFYTGRQTLIQSQAADAYRGRVFGALGTVQGIAMLIGLAIGGLLGEVFGIVMLLSASAMLRVIGGIIAIRWLPREERHLPPASQERGLGEPALATIGNQAPDA